MVEADLMDHAAPAKPEKSALAPKVKKPRNKPQG